MNFSNYKLSGRTLDLGATSNWTITVWPRAHHASDVLKTPLATWSSPLGAVGFSGVFCHYVATNYATVSELHKSLDEIRIWGPDALAQHFIVRDATGQSLVIECVNGVKQVYLDSNNGEDGYGITTNEPTFDWHLENIANYKWKRTLSRQAIATPGNFYPDERFLRTYMMKSGMQAIGYFNPNATLTYQEAIGLTAQILNVVSVPLGEQYGTDTGDSSGEGTNPDHTLWAVIRDHATPALYWRDSFNPTFRRLVLTDLDFSYKAHRKAIKLQDGPYFVDMKDQLQ
eukprot:scaffold2188_cov182-Ochromonas_danica.AAC.9